MGFSGTLSRWLHRTQLHERCTPRPRAPVGLYLRPASFERTFSWFGRNRRLAKDFENPAETLATWVTLASIQVSPRRVARA